MKSTNELLRNLYFIIYADINDDLRHFFTYPLINCKR